MQRTNREIAIGILTVGVFALLTVWVSARDAGSTSRDGFYRLTAQFNRVDGLLPGDEVRLSGVKIGEVEAQTLDDRFRAILTLSVSDDIVLPTDTSAAIHTNGLFGSKFIVLEPGGEFDELKDGDSILFTQDSLVVEDLLELIIREGKAKLAARDAETGAD
ncbi:MAG: MlaD family protein [Rhodospirillales bacterium]